MILFSGNHFGGYGSGGNSWAQGGPQGWNNVWGSQSNQGGWGNGSFFMRNCIYLILYLIKHFFLFIGGSWGGSQSGYGGGPMRGNFGNNRAVPYHTGRSNIFCLKS